MASTGVVVFCPQLLQAETDLLGLARDSLGRSVGLRLSAKGAPIEFSAVFNPENTDTKPPTHLGFCAEFPCQPEWGRDCCCWSGAGVDPHPSYPNPDLAEANRTCETPDPMRNAGYLMFKEPGFVGDSGRLLAIEAVSPAMDSRDLCCVYEADDVMAESRKSPIEHVNLLPPSTTWLPEPLPATTPRPTSDPFLAQDDLAASLEVSAKDYKIAALAIHDTAVNLEGALGAVKIQAEKTLEKKKVNNKLRGIITSYAYEAQNAVGSLHALSASTSF